MNKKGITECKNGSGLIIVGVIIGVILLIALMIAGTYNSFVSKDTNVENYWAKVQTAYERRIDLIPNLVETVKGYAKFEKETQTQIAMFRSGIKNAQTPIELDKVGNEMNSFVSGIMVNVEAYPDLKASQNFLALQDELAGTENIIKWERDNFNEAVKEYKLSVRTFPNNMIAGMFGFSESRWEMFKAQEGAEKVPEVNFD